MPLTSRDLEAIRAIVREEIARQHGEPDDDSSEAALEEAEQRGRAFMRRLMREPVPPPKPIPDTPFIDRYDAARLLNVGLDTVRTYTKRGLLTKHKVKGRLQFSRAEIDKLLAERGPRGRRR